MLYDLEKVKQTCCLGAYSAVLQNTAQQPCVAEGLQYALVVLQSENTAYSCPSRIHITFDNKQFPDHKVCLKTEETTITHTTDLKP